MAPLRFYLYSWIFAGGDKRERAPWRFLRSQSGATNRSPLSPLRIAREMVVAYSTLHSGMALLVCSCTYIRSVRFSDGRFPTELCAFCSAVCSLLKTCSQANETPNGTCHKNKMRCELKKKRMRVRSADIFMRTWRVIEKQEKSLCSRPSERE